MFLVAFRDRVMGNPRFLLQVCLELGLGVTAKTVAEYQARGDKFFKVSKLVLHENMYTALLMLLFVCKTFMMAKEQLQYLLRL